MSVDGDILESIAAALKAARLEAIVVGNTASELHGAPLATEDVDLLVRDTATNRRKIAKFVEAVQGYGPVDISELMAGKRIYLPESYVDLLFDKIAGSLTFNAVRSRSTRIAIGKHALTVASLEDVIRSKEAANREKDRYALPILRETLAVQQVLKAKEVSGRGGPQRRRPNRRRMKRKRLTKSR